MGFGKALFIIIRTCQGLFSLAALGCGAYSKYLLGLTMCLGGC